MGRALFLLSYKYFRSLHVDEFNAQKKVLRTNKHGLRSRLLFLLRRIHLKALSLGLSFRITSRFDCLRIEPQHFEAHHH